MGTRRSVHPLLLEPTYWRNRLQELGEQRPSLLLTPRPDLCKGGRDVVEFRVHAHDGQALRGLLARPTLRAGPWPARIRSVGPEDPFVVDRTWIEDGGAEFVFQEPTGRKLEDRVLDVVHISRMAFQTEGVDRFNVSYPALDEGLEPDEFRITEHLIAGKFF